MINVLGSLPTLILDFTHKQTNRGKNMSKVMQPIRTHELNHWSNVVREQFGHRKKSLETELFQEVKDKSKQMQPSFNKKIKVEVKLEQLRKAEKALNDFVSNKEKVERELQLNVAIFVEQLRNDLKNWNEVRQWDNTDCHSLKSLSAVEDYLEEVCYEETKEVYMKSEKGKLLSELNRAEDMAHNTLYSGGSIKDVVSHLSGIFKQCKIDVRIPEQLLQIKN